MKKNRKLIKQMKERGWRAELTKKNHIRFVFEKTGEFIIHAGTASDHRAVLNMLARAKRVEEGRQAA
ncbi:hypothetical protein MAL1_00172 [Bacteriophage DSS3_MAL1]|nr:hypothetical protein MAL1_00172 [Bacteriophage DSS3_MAL1]